MKCREPRKGLISEDVVNHPSPEDQKAYEQFFEEYPQLHDCSFRGENDILKTLKKTKAEVKHAG